MCHLGQIFFLPVLPPGLFYVFMATVTGFFVLKCQFLLGLQFSASKTLSKWVGGTTQSGQNLFQYPLVILFFKKNIKFYVSN